MVLVWVKRGRGATDARSIAEAVQGDGLLEKKKKIRLARMSEELPTLWAQN